MSNILMLHSGLMDNATYTASSSDADYPPNNIADIQPRKKWRTINNISEFILVDLLSIKTFDFIALLRTNIENDAAHTIRIRTSDTPTGLTAAPDYDSTAIRAIPSGAQSDYDYSNIMFKLPSQVTNRYVRIDLVASNNDNSFIEVGRLYISKSFIPDINISYKWSMGIEDKTKPTESIGGQLHPNPKAKRKVLKYSLAFQSEDQMYDYAFEIDKICGASKDVFIHKNIDNLKRYLDFSIYGLQESLKPIVNDAYALYSKAYSVREMI